jgi:hypothetical protein
VERENFFKMVDGCNFFPKFYSKIREEKKTGRNENKKRRNLTEKNHR